MLMTDCPMKVGVASALPTDRMTILERALEVASGEVFSKGGVRSAAQV